MVILSWLGYGMGVLGLIIAGHWDRARGWMIACLASVPWAIYAIDRREWALLATTLTYGAVDFSNYRIGKRDQETK